MKKKEYKLSNADELLKHVTVAIVILTAVLLCLVISMGLK